MCCFCVHALQNLVILAKLYYYSNIYSSSCFSKSKTTRSVHTCGCTHSLISHCSQQKQLFEILVAKFYNLKKQFTKREILLGQHLLRRASLTSMIEYWMIGWAIRFLIGTNFFFNSFQFNDIFKVIVLVRLLLSVTVPMIRLFRIAVEVRTGIMVGIFITHT